MRLLSLLAAIMIAVGAASFAFADRDVATLPEISWLCDVHMDREAGSATGTISLRVGAQTILITNEPRYECYVIPRTKYQLFGIPGSAITALHHGFGPASDAIWVVRRADALLVYDRLDWDEHRPKTRIIKQIRLHAKTSNQSLQPTASRRTAQLSDD